MKKYINKITAVAFVGFFFLLFNSCEDESEIFTISAPVAPVLSEFDFNQLELDPVNTNNPALTLSWQKANYGVQTSINYSIEFASDNNFTNPVVAATVTGQDNITLSVSEVNSAAGNAGLNPFEWKDLYARVVASIGTFNEQVSSSNTVSVSVYPYFNYTFNDFYLVGDATAPGWNNNNNNPPLFRDPNDSDRYTYTGRFSENGHFKVLSTKGMWQPQYGTDDGSTVGANLGSGSDPERFPYGGGNGIPEGFYTFEINFATNTFSFEPFTNTGASSPASLSVQGSSTSTVTMTPLSFDGHIWYANNVRLTPGELNFVTGAGSSWGSSDAFSGTATENGNAIPVVVEDDYDIWFNDLTGQYILIPLNL